MLALAQLDVGFSSHPHSAVFHQRRTVQVLCPHLRAGLFPTQQQTEATFRQQEASSPHQLEAYYPASSSSLQECFCLASPLSQPEYFWPASPPYVREFVLPASPLAEPETFCPASPSPHPETFCPASPSPHSDAFCPAAPSNLLGFDLLASSLPQLQNNGPLPAGSVLTQKMRDWLASEMLFVMDP
jgi:hypothetical protein